MGSNVLLELSLEEKYSMKKEITLGQLLAVAITLLISIVSAWVTINNKVTRLESQQQEYRDQQYTLQVANDKKFDKIDQKMDAISSDTRQILIKLENKADRK